MDRAWQETFRRRMRGFALHRPPREGEVPVSVKVRVASGCFHREHSPEAYAIIDAHLDEHARQECEFEFVEHESGPEVLVYIALATAGTTLLKSVIDLVTAVIKARSEGIRRGDRPRDPLDLVIRRVDSHDQVTEEATLHTGHTDPADRELVEAAIHNALARIQRGEDALLAKSAGRSARALQSPTSGPRRAADPGPPQRPRARSSRRGTKRGGGKA